ncbi:hypothetical protein [Paraburkholderia phytofirmans]|uniref:hypothetical protein n=1 Tax=Paraburkholderia phytofirmans TaxID=261302 RepID=UPI0038B948E9
MPRAANSFLEAQVLADACDAFGRSTGIFRATPARKHVSYSDASISFDLAGRKFEMPTLVTTRLGLAEMANTLLAESRSSAMEPHSLYRRLMLVAPYVEPQLARPPDQAERAVPGRSGQRLSERARRYGHD